MDANFFEKDYFGSSTIYGSAAPELERPEPEEREVPRERVRIRTAAKPVEKQGISLTAIIGWMSIAILSVALIMAYVELNTIANETYKLNNELEELLTEETRLKIEYESTFKLDEIESYAGNMLGMVKADNGQVRYLNNRYEDQAIALGEKSESQGIAAKLKSFFASFAEYFS